MGKKGFAKVVHVSLDGKSEVVIDGESGENESGARR